MALAGERSLTKTLPMPNVCCNRIVHSSNPELQLLLDALGERFVDTPKPISREPLGDGSIAGFAATEPAAIAYDDATARGEVHTNWYVDTSRRAVQQETGLVLGDHEKPEARIWLHPADPRLPALAPASFEHSARTLLARIGIDLEGAPSLLAYRAGKRAVFRMRGSAGATYLKVVRPAVVADLAASHTALADAGLPVPRVLAWGGIGLLVIPEAHGDPLSKLLDEADPDRLLDAIDNLRQRLGDVDLGREARPSLSRRSDWYVSRIRAAASDDEKLAELTETAIARLGPRPEPRRRQTVHGDLHTGQLFMREGNVSGLIDVDTAGTGDPTDDEAAFVGHLIASVAMRAAGGWPSDPVRRLANAAWQRWSRDDEALRHGVVVHALGHALLPAERGNSALATMILREALDLTNGR